MSTERPDIEAAAAKLTGFSKMQARKELRKLPEVLWEGEVVEILAQGNYSGKNGIVVLTNRRLVFVDMGLVRSRVEDFPIDRISSVQHSTKMMYGKLIVFASGNKAEIGQILPKQLATEIAETLRARMTAPKPTLRHEPEVVRQAADPAPQADPIEHLKKLAELRDAGIVSPEEFEAKKAEILKRM